MYNHLFLMILTLNSYVDTKALICCFVWDWLFHVLRFQITIQDSKVSMFWEASFGLLLKSSEILIEIDKDSIIDRKLANEIKYKWIFSLIFGIICYKAVLESYCEKFEGMNKQQIENTFLILQLEPQLNCSMKSRIVYTNIQ